MRPNLVAAALLATTPLCAQGERDPDWAFRPWRTATPPTVADAAWNAHPIDRFVRARLAAAGLAPVAVADKHTLIRRATFALTGLPPTPAEVDAFLADDTADSFVRVVDRLLASPHYGEHQARAWLDLARYSDSNGLDENLAFANAWRYRDWVVQAHNQDLPYDRFVAMQIAGDLLADDPAVGVDGYVATGFLALGPRMLAEQDKEKLVLDTVDEQVDLVGRTVLGLTIGCARCHDHKFDPIPTADYYALAGVFRSSKSFHNLDHVSRWFDREAASDAAVAARKQAEGRRDDAEKAYATAAAAAAAELRARIVGDAGRYLLAGHELLRRSLFVQAEDATATSLGADDRLYGDATTKILHTQQGGDQFAAWQVTATTAGRFQLAVRYAAQESRPMRARLDDVVVAESALAATTGGWRAEHQQWHAVATVDLAAGAHTLRLEALGANVPHLDAVLLTPVDQAHASDLMAPVVRQAATAFATATDNAVLRFWRELCNGDDAGFAARAGAAQGKGGLAAILLGGEPPATPRELATRAQVFFAAADAAATAAQRAKKKDDKSPLRLDEPLLEDAHRLLRDAGGLLAVPEPELRPFHAPATALRLQELADIRDGAVQAVPARAPTVICVVDDKPVDLPVHLRGSHLTLAAEKTPRGVLSALAAFVPPPTMPAERSGRAEFAAWLFRSEQALTARVLANRVWQRAFGQGLSRSPSNFGRRGDQPHDLDLLDWLAADLRASGWSQKALWRRILLSRTWQLGSNAPIALRDQDPDNRLLGRQNRVRLSAEGVRDALFAVAGTLDRTFGGSLLGAGDRDYVTNDQSNDRARYDAPRRALYLPIVRNAMYDLFTAFDYADPSVHIEQRPQTAVATQALILLNAPLVAQQAKALVARRPTSVADNAAIAWLWREALCRSPSPAESAAARAWLADVRKDGDEAAAWAGLAQALFASNEFVYVD
ncbi:MAG: DUF1549 domain-containing protein [Planctomycetes bacterium]|nr:DUF1549 domain-containing protein [Planctomycetota bacterium]